MNLRPTTILFGAGEQTLPVLPSCEHYAGSERFIAKALTLQSDLPCSFDLTLDCEDGAACGKEREHLEMILQTLCDLRRDDASAKGRIGVRIHGLETRFWRDELELLIKEARGKFSYLTLPKISGAQQAADFALLVRRLAGQFRWEAPPALHFIIETVAAVRQVVEIGRLTGVEVLDFGLMDYVSEFKGGISSDAMVSPGQFEQRIVAAAKTAIVEAALAAGVVPSHNPTFDHTSIDRCFADARRARSEFGFQRMWSIHPSQIQPIADAFAPDASDLKIAREVLLAAERADWGPISHDGRLHDRASYRYFWALLVRAKAAGRLLDPDCLKWFD